MLIPIRHENMSARRWPVITIGLIVANVVIFLATQSAMHDQAPQLGTVKAHILMLAAMHPELSLPPQEQQLVANFQKHDPTTWAQIKNPNHDLIDAWDAKMRLMDNPIALQAELDSLASEYEKLQVSSLTENYAFVPAHPKPIAYLTANFLHGGWLHLIGNMWFLWLAGFVLEDVWSRPLFSVFYLIAGAAALQFHAWTNVGSLTPTLGASGAVAALMGAFLVRFPNMKIEMLWLFGFFRTYRFKAAAYWLLPLWLLMEVFYGALTGASSGVAHWAHVGGFVFGALAALGLRHSGLEHKANQAIEEKVGWTADPQIEQANQLTETGRLDEAVTLLNTHLAAKPGSVDALSLLRDIHWRRNELPAYHETTAKLCAYRLKTNDHDAAFRDYEDFFNSGGKKFPAATWLELCRVLEEKQNFEAALVEYEKVISAYPGERQSLMAQLAAARICLKRLNRPQDAVALYQAAASSPVPHLDLEQNIQMGIREARAALPQASVSQASAVAK
jgi:membrane associated rhomboid family serine protease